MLSVPYGKQVARTTLGPMDDNRRLPHDPFICNRAIVGWYLSCSSTANPLNSGNYVAAYLCQHAGDRYAVVTTTRDGSIGAGGIQVLAVYLINAAHTLTRLSHWPEEIEMY